MKRPEKELREQVLAAVRARGAHKGLAIDLAMSDTELDLDITDAGHVADLRRVLKTVL